MRYKHSFFLLLLVLSCTPSSTAVSASHRQIIVGPIAGQVTDVLDGDTLRVRITVWIGQHVETSVRIAGIDTPEIHGACAAERKRARIARQEVQKLVADEKIHLSNIRLAKYAGRVLADAKTSDGTDIAAYMLKKGLARIYNGKKRRSWCKT